MTPGSKYHVYLLEAHPHLPSIRFHEDSIQVFASLAVVYKGDELLWDYEELNLSPPVP